jgi:UDPglucose 6-dehydrogenase/GDP-mannose 6-dehydrogenase
VTCIDIDEQKVDNINRRIPPIHERDLEELLKEHVGKNLSATTDFRTAIEKTELSIIAVGTPFDGRAIDLTYVKEVSQKIGAVLRTKTDFHTVVVKSTVVPGTTDGVVLQILKESSGKKAGDDFGVGMNPEFLTEGQAVQDFMNPDRLVLGGIDDRSIDMLEQLYRPFVGVPRIRTNCRTAEMIKYASNCMLATQISFINELGSLCTALGDVDVSDVSTGLRTSSYLSMKGADGKSSTAPIASFLEAGCGFGGSCLPKDVNALIAHGQKLGLPMALLSAVISTNNDQPSRLVDIIKSSAGGLKGITVGILGLAFKPDTDDMRESPAIPIIRSLQKEGAKVYAHDPVAIPEAKKIFDGTVQFVDDLLSIVKKVSILVLVTRWDEYRAIPEILQTLRLQPLVIDGRRMLDKDQIQRYEGIGFRRQQ